MSDPRTKENLKNALNENNAHNGSFKPITQLISRLPDDSGYYTILLGRVGSEKGLPNDLDEARRIINVFRKGVMCGELGFPVIIHCKSHRENMSRVQLISENNVSHHMSDIYLKSNDIIAKIKPAGPHAALFEKAIEENFNSMYLGLRSLCNVKTVPTPDMLSTIVERTVIKIITWDLVEKGTMGDAIDIDPSDIEIDYTPQPVEGKVSIEEMVEKVIDNSVRIGNEMLTKAQNVLKEAREKK